VADFVFNIAKGAAAEKVRDSATVLGILLLRTVESDALMKDRADVAAVVANSTEANFTNYARKTGLTGTVTVDTTNDRVDVDVPDQTWTAAGGATNNTLLKAVVFYEESASDSGRVPLVGLDLPSVITDGTNILLVIATAGFYRAT
jgi:hypothetical protein